MVRSYFMRFSLTHNDHLRCDYVDIETNKPVGWVVWRRAGNRLWKVFSNSASMAKKKHVHISNTKVYNLFEREYAKLLIERDLLGGD